MVKFRILFIGKILLHDRFRHRWLQYISDDTPVEKPLKRQSWMIDTIENKTGTSQIYVPYTTVRGKIDSWQPPLPSSSTQNATATKSQH